MATQTFLMHPLAHSLDDPGVLVSLEVYSDGQPYDCDANRQALTQLSIVPVLVSEIEFKPDWLFGCIVAINHGYLHYKIAPYETLNDLTREGTCPKCGDEGRFIRTALVCNEHGLFGGF